MGFSAAGLAIIAGGGYLTGKGPAGSLAPKPKALPQVPAMPDQTVINQQQQLQAALAQGRSGRASTVLSSGSDAGTADRLGP